MALEAAKLLSDAKDRVFDDLAGMFQHLALVLTRRKKSCFTTLAAPSSQNKGLANFFSSSLLGVERQKTFIYISLFIIARRYSNNEEIGPVSMRYGAKSSSRLAPPPQR